jgi:hypothetical protein
MMNKKKVGKRGLANQSMPRRDPVKEGRIAALVAELLAQGVVVRREELKRGLGWRALSGACRVFGQNTLFVDRRLGVDDQIAFLEARLTLLKQSDDEAVPKNFSVQEITP